MDGLLVWPTHLHWIHLQQQNLLEAQVPWLLIPRLAHVLIAVFLSGGLEYKAPKTSPEGIPHWALMAI